jgi:ubiquinone biosynthesis protein COQ9
MSHPERSPERDAALAVVLDLVPEHGWAMTSLRQVVADPDELSLLFPGGTSDLIEASCDLADRQMESDAAAADLSELGLIKRVKAVIALRFARQRANRDAIRRAISVLVLPRHFGLSLKITARTVDAILHAAGDRSADFTWYTKRATLVAVYTATLLYWLRDYSDDDSETLEFLDRRLAGIGRVGKARGRLDRLLHRVRPEKAAEI